VTVCYMKPSIEFSIEGRAKVRYLIRHVDEQYVVEFDNEPGENYESRLLAAGRHQRRGVSWFSGPVPPLIEAIRGAHVSCFPKAKGGANGVN
jgi:hypothetical protein